MGKTYQQVIILALLSGCQPSPPAKDYTTLKRDLLELRQNAAINPHSKVGLAVPSDFFRSMQRLENDYRLQRERPGSNSCQQIDFSLADARILWRASKHMLVYTETEQEAWQKLHDAQTVLTHAAADAVAQLESEERTIHPSP